MKKNILTLSLLFSLCMAGTALLSLAAQAEPENQTITAGQVQEARTEILEKTQATQESQKKSITLFAHGLGGHKRKIDARHLTFFLTYGYGEYLEKTGLDFLDQIIFYQKNGTIEKDGVSFPTYTVTDPKNPLANCSLGQAHEMDNAQQAMATITENNPDTDIVFRGVSLGASTGINFAGTRPEFLKKYKVKGAILESPFAHVRDIPDSKACGLTRILPNILLKLAVRLCAFPNHDLTGIQPPTSAATIPHDFPVLIIASKEDALIPWQSSKKIYDQCVKSGHKQAHFLLVEHGAHAGICFSDKCACDGRK